MGIAPDFDILTTRFYTFIEDAYTHANRTLLQLLLKDQQLIPRLRSLKHYLFVWLNVSFQIQGKFQIALMYVVCLGPS